MDDIRIWIWIGVNLSRAWFPQFAGAEIRSRSSHALRPRAGPPLPVELRFPLAMRHSIAPASGHAPAGVAAGRGRRAQPTATSRRMSRRMPIPTS